MPRLRARPILVLLFLLLGGAVANIAVAWALAIFGSIPAYVRPQRTFPRADSILVHGPFEGKFGTPHEMQQQLQFKASAFDLRMIRCSTQKYDERGVLLHFVDGKWVEATRTPQFESRSYEIAWYEAGFPMRSLCGGEWTIERWLFKDIQPQRELQTGVWFGDKRPAAGDSLAECRFIAYGPLWPGFAVNTLLYASLLWIPWVTRSAVRRVRRRRRGRCVKCAYDLHGIRSSNCPECGTAITT